MGSEKGKRTVSFHQKYIQFWFFHFGCKLDSVQYLDIFAVYRGASHSVHSEFVVVPVLAEPVARSLVFAADRNLVVGYQHLHLGVVVVAVVAVVVDNRHLAGWAETVGHIDVAVVAGRDLGRRLVVPGLDEPGRLYPAGVCRSVEALLGGKRVGELEEASRCRRARALRWRWCLWIACICGLGFVGRELPCLRRIENMCGS